MNDAEIVAQIDKLVDEEHQLERDHGERELSGEERARLGQIEVQLDQCWDLLRQRRARRHAGKDPGKAMDNHFKIESGLETVAAARAKTADANHFLYMVKTNQLASADPAKIKMPVLLLYSPTDLVFQEQQVAAAAGELAAAGSTIETGKLIGPYGHNNGVFAISQAADQIRAFIDK